MSARALGRDLAKHAKVVSRLEVVKTGVSWSPDQHGQLAVAFLGCKGSEMPWLRRIR